ncbi:hypothetical protein RU95_GL002233 [Enterococcus avium]|nr:hypothetical protein RU95_GL002233 [Enterococcus avium]
MYSFTLQKNMFVFTPQIIISINKSLLKKSKQAKYYSSLI